MKERRKKEEEESRNQNSPNSFGELINQSIQRSHKQFKQKAFNLYTYYYVLTKQ